MSRAGKHSGDSNLVPVTFNWTGEGDFVEIRGSFGLPKNPDWKPMAMTWSKELDGFFITLKLEHGKFYHYKYVVDGKWVCDMSADTSVDAQGNQNNVIYVPYTKRKNEPDFDAEASTEEEQQMGGSQLNAREDFYEGKGSRRRSSSTAAPHSGQSYPSSGGSASLRKTSVNSTGYEAGNQYRKEAGYKNSQLDKWEQEALPRQGQMPRKSSKQSDYGDEYVKQGKRDPSGAESRGRMGDGYTRIAPSEAGPSGHNRRSSLTGSESGYGRPRSRSGSMQMADHEIPKFCDCCGGTHPPNAGHLPGYQMDYQPGQPELSENRSRSYSGQSRAPLPGYNYQTRQTLPVGPQLREHEARRGSLSRASGSASRHVSFDPATLSENYDAVDLSDPEYVSKPLQAKGKLQPRDHEDDEDSDQVAAQNKEKHPKVLRQNAEEAMLPVKSHRHGYPTYIALIRSASEGSQDSEHPTETAGAEDGPVAQTRSQVKSHRRNRFGQGSAGFSREAIQTYSDQENSDQLDAVGGHPPPATPLKASYQNEEIPQSSSRRGSVNSASFPRGRKASNPSIHYPGAAMPDNGDDFYRGSGASSKGRQGGSQRYTGASKPASRLQIPSEFMAGRGQKEPSYSRNEDTEYSTDATETPYDGPGETYQKRGYPSDRAAGSVGRKGSINAYSQGRGGGDAPKDRYRKPSLTTDFGSRNDAYGDQYTEASVDPSTLRRRSVADQDYVDPATGRARRRSKADQFEYAESASGKTAIYFDPATGKFVRSYDAQRVDNAADQEYDVAGSGRRRSNADRAGYYDPSSEKNYTKQSADVSGRYEARPGKYSRDSVSSKGVRDDIGGGLDDQEVGEVNPRSGRRRSSVNQSDVVQAKSTSALKQDPGSSSSKNYPATGKTTRGSVSSKGARDSIASDQDDQETGEANPKSGRRRPSIHQTDDAMAKASGKPNKSASRFDPATGKFVYDNASPQGDEEDSDQDTRGSQNGEKVDLKPHPTGYSESSAVKPSTGHRDSGRHDSSGGKTALGGVSPHTNYTNVAGGASQSQTSDNNFADEHKVGRFDSSLGRFVYDNAGEHAPDASTQSGESRTTDYQEPSIDHSLKAPTDHCGHTSLTGDLTGEASSEPDSSVARYDPVARKFVGGSSTDSESESCNPSSNEALSGKEPSSYQENSNAVLSTEKGDGHGSGTTTGAPSNAPIKSSYFDPASGMFITASTPSEEACDGPDDESSTAAAVNQNKAIAEGESVGMRALGEVTKRRFGSQDQAGHCESQGTTSAPKADEASFQDNATSEETSTSEDKSSSCQSYSTPSSEKRVYDPRTGKFVYAESQSTQGSSTVSRGTPAQLSRRPTGLATQDNATSEETSTTDDKSSSSQSYSTPGSGKRVYDSRTGKFIYTGEQTTQVSSAVSRATPAQLSRRTTGLVTQDNATSEETSTTDDKSSSCQSHSTPGSDKRVYDPRTGKFVYAEGQTTQVSSSVSRATPAQLSRRTTGLTTQDNATSEETSITDDTVDDSTNQSPTPATEDSCSSATPRQGSYYDAAAGKFVTSEQDTNSGAAALASAVQRAGDVSESHPSTDGVQNGGHFDASSGRFIIGSQGVSSKSNANDNTSEGSYSAGAHRSDSSQDKSLAPETYSGGHFEPESGKFVVNGLSSQDSASSYVASTAQDNNPTATNPGPGQAQAASASGQAGAYFDPSSGKFVSVSQGVPVQHNAKAGYAASAPLAGQTGGYFDVNTGKFVNSSQAVQGQKVESAQAAAKPIVVAETQSSYGGDSSAIKTGTGYFDMSTGRFISGSQPLRDQAALAPPSAAQGSANPKDAYTESKVAAGSPTGRFDPSTGKFVKGSSASGDYTKANPSVVKYAANGPSGGYFDVKSGKFVANGPSSQIGDSSYEAPAAPKYEPVVKAPSEVQAPLASRPAGAYFDPTSGKFVSATQSAPVQPAVKANPAQESSYSGVSEVQAAPSSVGFFDPATGRFSSSPKAAHGEQPGAENTLPIKYTASNVQAVSYGSSAKASSSAQGGGYFDVSSGRFVSGSLGEAGQIDPSGVADQVPNPAPEEKSGSYFDPSTGKFHLVSQIGTGDPDTSSYAKVFEYAYRDSSSKESTAVDLPTGEESAAHPSEDQAAAPLDDSEGIKQSESSITLPGHKKKSGSTKKRGSKSKSKARAVFGRGARDSQPGTPTELDDGQGSTTWKSKSQKVSKGLLRLLDGQVQSQNGVDEDIVGQSEKSYSSDEASDDASAEGSQEDDPDKDSAAQVPQENLRVRNNKPTEPEAFEMALFSKSTLAMLVGIYMVASYNSASGSAGSMLMVIPLLCLLSVCVTVMNASAWIKYSNFGWRCNADMSITLFEDADNLNSRSLTLSTNNLIAILFLGLALISILAVTSASSFYAVGSMVKKSSCCSGL